MDVQSSRNSHVPLQLFQRRDWFTSLKPSLQAMAMSSDLQTEIGRLIAQSRDHGKLSSAAEQITKVLLQHGLAYKQKIQPWHVGIHPQNRDGLGVSSNEVHSLISDILQVGFSWEEASRSICVEVDPSDQKMKEFNTKLSQQAGGKLAFLDNIRFASVAGSHLNAGLNCWLQSLEHSGSGTLQGRLSVALLKELDRQYYEATQDGLTWLVIGITVVKTFPDIPALLQSAGNVASHLAREESELQLLRKIHSQLVKCQQTKTVVTWSDIAAQVLRSKPTHAMSCPSLFQFICKFSGGKDGALLVDTENYVKSDGFPRRALGASVYDALSGDFKGQDQYALFRHCRLSATGRYKSGS